MSGWIEGNEIRILPVIEKGTSFLRFPGVLVSRHIVEQNGITLAATSEVAGTTVIAAL
jgi:hypothetical protein